MAEDTSLRKYDFSQYQEEISAFKTKINNEKQALKKHFSSPSYFSTEYTPKTTNTIEVNINLADTLAYEELPGIGPYFAKRICKYRNLLGGFYSKKQLLEVYKMDSLRYAKIENYLVVSAEDIQKRNINELTEYELRKHPYISSNLARLIMNYRKQHGDYEKLEELYDLHLIDSLNFRKIAYYFTANEYISFREED